MQRIPKPLARRIDRLSRHAHAFHRFAHHPLCGRYAGELVALGRRDRLCRGCLLAVSGASAGLAVGIALPTLGGLALALGLGLAAVAVGWLAPARRSKLGTRLLPAAALACAFGAGLRGPVASGAPLSGAALASGLGFLWAYRRHGPNRAPCLTCPEYAALVPCSGVQPILRREAAFRRLTSRWLDAAPTASPPAPSRAPPRAAAAPAAP
jgi:hypothetical protein